MVLNIFALLFVLGITFMHSIFGLFSGIINLFCCIVALAVAFGYAEPLNNWVTGTFHLHSSYTEPFALVVLFVLTLLVLRLLADNFLRGNVHIPMHVDWGGGAACGFVNAQICVGVMAMGFLLLPWGDRVAGFSRWQRDPKDQINPYSKRVEFTRHNLWLRSDEFAVGLFNLLSEGSLRGKMTFASVYPDYPEWIFWSGNTVQHESLVAPIRDENSDGFNSGLTLESWWVQPALGADLACYRKELPTRVNDRPEYKPMAYPVQPGKRLIGVRLALRAPAADRDKDWRSHRFRPTMIRLVGDRKRPDGSLEPRQYAVQVIGGGPKVTTDLRIVDLDADFSLPAEPDARLDVFFEVDEEFQPRFVEYRRHARAPLTSAHKKDTPPSDRLAAARTGERAPGASRFMEYVIRERTGDLDVLPFAMSRQDIEGYGVNVELDGNLFAEGRVMGDRDGLEASFGDRVARFKVPEDKRIFQLAFKPRRVQSLFGQVMNFVRVRTNTYWARDEGGNSYAMAGYYFIATEGGRESIEMFFTPDPGAVGYGSNLDLKQLNHNDLQNEGSVLGLIFVVPRRACIDRLLVNSREQLLGESFCGN